MAQLPRDQHATDASTQREKKNEKEQDTCLWRFVANTRETVDGMAGLVESVLALVRTTTVVSFLEGERAILFWMGNLFGILKLNNKNNKQTIFSRV